MRGFAFVADLTSVFCEFEGPRRNNYYIRCKYQNFSSTVEIIFSWHGVQGPFKCCSDPNLGWITHSQSLPFFYCDERLGRYDVLSLDPMPFY